MFLAKDIKPCFDRINTCGHGFNKINQLKINNKTHFNSKRLLKEER
jgi:hypothetical protein